MIVTQTPLRISFAGGGTDCCYGRHLGHSRVPYLNRFVTAQEVPGWLASIDERRKGGKRDRKHPAMLSGESSSTYEEDDASNHALHSR